MRKSSLLKAGLLGLATTLTSCQKPESSNPKPNVVFFLVDDMGWTDLGCFGSSFYETPNIDKLANQGVKFTNAYASCPVCSPTRASLMCGKYPARINLTDWIKGRQHYRVHKNEKLLNKDFEFQMALQEETIAENLKKNGYNTCFVGKWHLGETPEFWPENQGFDVNIGGWSKGAPHRSKNSNGYFSPYGNPRLKDGPKGEYLTDRLTNEAVKYIDNKYKDPFFLYMSYYTVHNPMQGKKELVERFKEKARKLGLDTIKPFTYNKKWQKNLPKSRNYKERILQSHATYAAMVYSLDESVGKIVEKLKEKKIDKNTIICFTADNGGLSTSEGSPTCNYPLRAGKGWLYEGGVREPTFVVWPHKGKKGISSDYPVTSTDFYPTILEMCGLEPNPDQHIDGKSFAHAVKGELKDRVDPLFWHYPHYSNQGGKPGAAIRLGNYKLIEFFEDGKTELYNLADDISESNDLSDKMPDKTSELKLILHKWQKKVNAQFPKANPDYDPNFVSNSWKKK